MKYNVNKANLLTNMNKCNILNIITSFTTYVYSIYSIILLYIQQVVQHQILLAYFKLVCMGTWAERMGMHIGERRREQQYIQLDCKLGSPFNRRQTDYAKMRGGWGKVIHKTQKMDLRIAFGIQTILFNLFHLFVHPEMVSNYSRLKLKLKINRVINHSFVHCLFCLLFVPVQVLMGLLNLSKKQGTSQIPIHYRANRSTLVIVYQLTSFYLQQEESY